MDFCPAHSYGYDWAAGKPADVRTAGSWEQFGVDGAHHSLGGLGSLGVFFINLKSDAGVVVAKQASSQSASELSVSSRYHIKYL